MTQKPMLRAEVGVRMRSANRAGAMLIERGGWQKSSQKRGNFGCIANSAETNEEEGARA